MDLQKQWKLRDLKLLTGKGLLATCCVLAGLLHFTGSCKSRTPITRTTIKDDAQASWKDKLTPACKTACANTESDENWAVCYSCRCKEAMDGWLPSPREVSCDAGREIPVYEASKTASGITLKKITSGTAECFNPPRLPDARHYGGGCYPGSKLGQLQRGPVWAKWICRREKDSGKFFDSNHNYEDHGLIMFNERTGATCFFDDTNGTTNGRNNPDIDLTSGDPAKVRAFLGTYYRTEGYTCIGCHDNDPFMYSPYLKGAGWESSPSYTLGKFFAVRTIEPEKSHVKYLTAEKASPCLMCHRIGEGNTCRVFATDSAGNPEIDSMHAWLRGSSPWGIVTDETGGQWSTPAWMPPDMGEDEIARESWRTDYAAAVQTIEKCCEDHSAPGCSWATIGND